MTTWYVTSFYRFLALTPERLAEIQLEMTAWMTDNNVLGLVVIAQEGVNGTVAGSESSIAAYKTFLANIVALDDIRFKDSTSEIAPFNRVTVAHRREIVGMKRPDLVPTETDDHHLSPREWHEFLASDRPRLVVDTRNDYETRLGKFVGAVDPGLEHFSNWAEYADSTEMPKDTPVLIYCTGGIRCEKVLLDMRMRGYEQVYQLRDGILGYLAEYPNGFYEGECFVFDERVALDADLKPTQKFGICPCCGLTSDHIRTCIRCGVEYFGCEQERPTWGPVCSKTCLDRYRRHGAPANSAQA